MNKKKFLRAIINNQKNIRYDDFTLLIEAFGFMHTRTDGSHSIFKNTSINELINIQNIRGQAKPYQIKQFLSIVEKYNLELEE